MRIQMLWLAMVMATTISLAPASSATCAERKLKDPEVSAVMAQVMQRYADCIVEQAEALEKSGEATPAIASAAVSACQSWRDKTQKMIMLNSMVNHGLKVESAGEVAQTILKEIDDSGRDHASLRVIQIRAKNAAPPQ